MLLKIIAVMEGLEFFFAFGGGGICVLSLIQYSFYGRNIYIYMLARKKWCHGVEGTDLWFTYSPTANYLHIHQLLIISIIHVGHRSKLKTNFDPQTWWNFWNLRHTPNSGKVVVVWSGFLGRFEDFPQLRKRNCWYQRTSPNIRRSLLSGHIFPLKCAIRCILMKLLSQVDNPGASLQS